MKKVFYIITLATLAFAACERKDEIINEQQMTYLSIGIDESDTKTVLTGMLDLRWQTGDQIAVDIAGEGVTVFTLYDGAGTTTGNFACAKQVTVEGGRTTFYPASLNPGYNDVDKKWHVTLPDTYSWSDQGIRAPMYTWLGGGYDNMKLLCGVLKVEVYNIPATADKLVFTTKGEKITGDFAFDETDIDTSASDIEKSVTISFEAGSSSMKTFFIPVPVGTYAAGATIEIKEGDTQLVKKTAPALTVARGEIKYLPSLKCSTVDDAVVYSGSYDIGNWGDVAPEYNFVSNNVHAGQVLHFDFSQDAKVGDKACTYWQLCLDYNKTGWPNFLFSSLPAGATSFDFVITEDIATELNGGSGLIVSGYGITVTGVKVVTPQSETVLWVGNHSLGTGDWTNLSAKGLMAASTWSSLTAGKVLTVYYDYIGVDNNSAVIKIVEYYPWTELGGGYVPTNAAGTNGSYHECESFVSFTLTAEQVSAIKAGGLALSGVNLAITKITLK